MILFLIIVFMLTIFFVAIKRTVENFKNPNPKFCNGDKCLHDVLCNAGELKTRSI